MFSGEHRDEGRRRFLSNTEPLLLNLLWTLRIVFKEGAYLIWKWAWNRLCETKTFLVSVNNNTVFMRSSTDSFFISQFV
jgi:hypothetical protein